MSCALCICRELDQFKRLNCLLQRDSKLCTIPSLAAASDALASSGNSKSTERSKDQVKGGWGGGREREGEGEGGRKGGREGEDGETDKKSPAASLKLLRQAEIERL